MDSFFKRKENKRKKTPIIQLDNKILYIDMDSVLVDFIGAFNALDEDV